MAEHYVGGLASGRFAGRNRFEADEARVSVSWAEGSRSIVFDPFACDLDGRIGRRRMARALVSGTESDPDELIGVLVDGLRREAQFVEVRWSSRQDPGSAVTPSQEQRSDADGQGLRTVYAGLGTRDGDGTEIASLSARQIGGSLHRLEAWTEPLATTFPQLPIAALRRDRRASSVNAVVAACVEAIRREPGAMLAELDAGAPSPLSNLFVANLVRGGRLGWK